MEAEITAKIRESIRKKLIEYDAFVDDELPEYIMVLIANKKTKDQMDDDLALFLGKNTGKFTTWLHNTLYSTGTTKLQERSGDSAKTANVNSIRDVIDKPDAKSAPAEEEDILALNAQEQETDDFLAEELGEEQQRKKECVADVEYCSSKVVIDTSSSIPDMKKNSQRVTAKELFLKQATTISAVKTIPKLEKMPPKSVVKTSYLPHIAESLQSNDNEYDPQSPSVTSLKSVASRVQAIERRPSVPLSRQANKLLLLKAVEDANKSILGKQNVDEIYKPTPIKVLMSSAQHHSNSPSDKHSKNKSDIVQTNVKSISSPLIYVPKTHSTDNVPRNTSTLEDSVDGNIPDTGCRKVILNPDISVDCSSQNNMDSKKSVEGTLNNKPVSPHFVVTLDGVNLSTLKRKWSTLSLSDESENEDIESMDVENSEILSETSPKKVKPTERCRFWPSCKNGDSCEYHHPTVPCKTFPNCKYGDKCFYIHPKCKFDTLCSRKDCSYTHTSKRDFAVSGGLPLYMKAPKPVKFSHTPPSSYSVPTCKFFPNCSAYNCPFLHPKPCRFGSDCHSSTCAFTHPPFPSPNKLKWKSETAG